MDSTWCARWETCNKGILLIQKMGKCIFELLGNFFSFNWRAKLMKQLRYATYGLEICCSYLSSINHTYISMVKQTISAS